MSSLLEVALSGNEEQKPFDYKLRPEITVYVDLALGCTKEPARSLWISMQDYAVSKGKMLKIHTCVHVCVESILHAPTTRLAESCIFFGNNF